MTMATRRSARQTARAHSSTTPIKPEPSYELPPSTPKRKREATKPDASAIGDLLSVKKEDEADEALASPSKKISTSERKLASYKASITGTPFPEHALPTPEEAERVAWILGDFHGYKRESEGGRGLPRYTPPSGDDKYGGCGDVPSVLDATIRTVLSCNTSNRNSAAAHRSLTERFGRQNWTAIHEAPESELVEAIRCGGLANNKARTIKGILAQTLHTHGTLSLDHLHAATDDEIMRELVSFNGVGPKVASCVLAFCIGRQSMAVDTHVFRLCKSLGWVPDKANRDQTYYHLHERVPGHLKYPLHVLLIQHGKRCATCSAKGFATVKEERDEDGERVELSDRPCPLKAAGLLGRKGKALKDAAAASVKSEPEASASSTLFMKPDPDAPAQVKSEAGVEEVDYAAALEAARVASSEELLRMVQKARGTRSKNALCARLKKGGYSLELVHASELSSEQRKRVFGLFESNMKAMYRNSTLGWKPAEKKKELFDAESRFAIIRPPAEEGAEIAGFAMFRFDTERAVPGDPTRREGEDRVEVIYLYEIHIRKANQRDGLGSELMDVVYTLGRSAKMRKVMLTVFDANKPACAFYQRQGYKVDPVSPSVDAERSGHVDFDIMFKQIWL